jgi:RND superfamily putative drug exporter
VRRLLATLSAASTGRRSRWVVIGAWVALAVAAVPLQPALQREAADESDTFLVRGAESTAARDAIDARFRSGAEMAAVIVYERDGGLTSADRTRIDADARALCGSGEIPAISRVGTPFALACGRTDPLDLAPPLSISGDSALGLSAVLMRDDSTPTAEAAVAAIRAIVPPPEGDETGLRAWVTGEAGFEADRSAAVEGIDETLLLVTVGVLLVLLLAIYRSPLVALVPLVVVVLAYLVAAGVTYGLVSAGATTISGQTTAILIVLMFGAGTDYCLLIVARFRDELGRRGDVAAAMVHATERTAPAILSAGAIVVVAMLTLALADFNATREMGPILALGVAIMVAAGLTLLPAVLTALGRRAFWPAVPRAEGSEPARAWAAVARGVRRRPAATAAAVTALLAAGALGALADREPLGFADSFRDPPASVQAQAVIAEHFIPGRVAPVGVVSDLDAAPAVVGALNADERLPVTESYLVAQSVPGSGRTDLGLSEAYLGIDPFSREAADAIPRVRAVARDAAGGTPVLVGGEVAEAYDTRQALARDTRLIVPITLVLVLAILAVLLRAVVMPLYVVATVILSFGFALGASGLIFTHVLDQPASDPSLPLFAFIFLVALGVDYNVFLLARIREERERLGTEAAVTAALERTGGIITSAGLVLAATFGVLMSLELEALFQVGFVVALGLLADTFLVRALLVPAIALLLGERNWWPHLSADRNRASDENRSEVVDTT